MARASFVDVALRLRGARRFNAEVATATKQLEAMGVKGAASMGAFAQKASRFSHAGRQLTTRLTLPIVAAGAAAVKMSMDYNASFGKIDRMVGISSDQLVAWKGEILGLSRTTAQAPKELADAMYFITSAGLRGKTAMEALEASAKGGAAGLGSVEATADAVTSAMNTYGPSVLSAADATDIMFAAVKAGKMSGEDIAPVIGEIAPLADALSLSFDQAAASLATMTKLNGNARRSATQTSAVFSSFMNANGKMTASLDQMGLSVDQVRKQLADKGLAPTLFMLRKEATKAGIDFSQIFSNKRALNGFLQLTKNAKVTNEVFRDTADAAGFTDKAFKKLEETKGFQIKKALNELRVSMIELGEELAPVVLPAITKALQAVGSAFKALKKQPKGVKVAFLALVGILAILGPALMLLGVIAKGVGVALIIATSPVSLIVLAIIGLIAILVVAYLKLGWFRKYVQFVFKVLATYVKVVFTIWKTVILGVIKAITAYFKVAFTTWKGIIKGLAAAFNWVKTAVANVDKFIIKTWNGIIGFFKGLPGKIKSAFSGAFDGVKDAFRDAINFIIRAWNKLEFKVPKVGPFGGGTIGTPDINEIPRAATGGTVTQPGLTMVGERGPELLSLPKGASVIPLTDRVAASATSGPSRIEVPVYLNGRQIALAVADEVSNARARA